MTTTPTAVRFGPTTLHRPTRRRRAAFLGALLVLAATTVVMARHLLDDAHRAYLSTDGWPSLGQGAYRLGDGQPATSANQRPSPIASLAKVMTAYLVLQRLPLQEGDDGPTFTLGQADVADTDRRRGTDQSVVAVRAGERLTEREALMALLLPSANNIAQVLARAVSGSTPQFVARMNATAYRLGMWETRYTDPSGFDAGTVSTATDQLRLAQAAAANQTLLTMMSTRSFELPVAGTVHNTDTLLGSDGFAGMKTGSDDAAGGCFMFLSVRMVHGHRTQLIGVVLGQRGYQLVAAGLYAAKQLVDRVAPQAATR